MLRVIQSRVAMEGRAGRGGRVGVGVVCGSGQDEAGQGSAIMTCIEGALESSFAGVGVGRPGEATLTGSVTARLSGRAPEG
jgi:hypothetical protein